MKKILSASILCLFSVCAFSETAEPAIGIPAKKTDAVTKSIIPEPIPRPTPKPIPKPGLAKAKDIEIVFVVDTTGSMGGLIQGAKTKIWNIVNDILQHQKKGTKVKIGLVAYRDRGDEYVTQITGLSENLDDVYSTLMAFQARGGGDEPEDVRRALHESVNSIQWSKTRKNLSKIIFLVGDARPHTDYNDYPTTVETAKSAKKNGIIINTIQCGKLRETDKYWREIAQYAGGEYFAIPQDGGTKTISTPYDEELTGLSRKLDEKYIPYGKVAEQKRTYSVRKATADRMAAEAPAEAMASRAYNKSINAYSYSKDDLVQAIENKTISLEDIKENELPLEMQKMSKEEQKKYVENMIKERKEIREKIKSISKKRDTYIKDNTKEPRSSFDAAVSEALKKQIK